MYYTALLIGLAGSFHCAGMCSPLAMAVVRSRVLNGSIIVYNTGRILTYAMLGATAAALGTYINWVPYQLVVSLAMGILFLGWGIMGFKRIRVPLIGTLLESISGKLKMLFSEFLSRKNSVSTFILGMLNGLLPCGLTYIALSACLILPGAWNGFLFMLVFGLGTWPVMIGVTGLLTRLFHGNRIPMNRLSRLAFVFIGCVLIARTFWVQPPQKITVAGSSVILCE